MIDERMFDFKAFYQRIAKLLPDNCRIVEVGVADGASALFLAQELKSLGKNFTLYMVDNMDYGGYDQMKTIFKNIFESGLYENIEVIAADSLKASEQFNGNSLDFVFLDSSHELISTRKEIFAWYPKLKDDCILAGHDFYSVENPGVGKAVKMMLPEIIQRPPIVEQEQTFAPHQFLFTEKTERECGLWYVTKVFYWQPTLKR